ncbi:molybdopterin converting factor subunit 1 [Microvirga aerilata]|jgi:sulfur-carrier protein|uniref:Molybdopterin converting factor subunit 1 n=1 Tax=Microvirga aerilata TaxID=670292 RepID=A0A936ZN46_9HYPH|nr:molybdopterin converting factor subunit 1 [Microvirga aerilata]MBL0407739.1 molybdopterin converting factor subunit 1 [Microvirga aerilata]
MNTKLVYFAWVRERIGKSDEEVSLPSDVATVADLVTWLKSRGEEYEYAFENEGIVRAAVDHVHVRPNAFIHGAREIAFFPPMTGG